MDTPEIDIQLIGERVAPSTLDVIDLVEILPTLRKAICAAADIPSDSRTLLQPLLSLVGVSDGSAVLRLGATHVMYAGAERIRQAVVREDYGILPHDCQAHLHGLSASLARKKWRMRLHVAEGEQDAEISQEHPFPAPAPRRARGTTTLYGKVLWVGGEKQPTASIVPLGEMHQMTVRLSDPELAREVAGRLYRIVGLDGEGVWDPVEWKLHEFKASRLLPYVAIDPVTDKAISPVNAFEELAKDAGDAWEGVDADEYVRRLRAEEDEG